MELLKETKPEFWLVIHKHTLIGSIDSDVGLWLDNMFRINVCNWSDCSKLGPIISLQVVTG